jgi:ABC-type lipoprotein release transport system permease subunit
MAVGWFLAVRQIRRSSKWTTGLIIFIMVLTFLNLVVVSGLLVGLLTGSYGQFRENYSGDVFITPKPGREYIENSNEILSFIKNHPDVINYSDRNSVIANVLGTLDDNPKSKEKANQAGGAIVGIDPTQEERLTGFSKFLIKGEALRPEDDNFILIGASLIKEYSTFADVDIPGLELLKGVKVGDKVRATFSLKGSEPISKDFVVKGIVKSKVDQISQRMFVVQSGLRRLLPVNEWEVQEIAIRTLPGKEVEVQKDLRNYIGDSPVRVQTSLEAIPAFLRDIETTFGILGNALSSIALVVATITIFIVIFINAVTRRKFIGIMKGIGIEPRAIQAAYVFQALFYGLTGALLGLILTFGVLKPYFDANPIDFPFSDGILAVTYAGAGFRVGILLVVTVIAGFVPATLIVRKNTLDSILGR